MSLRVVMTEQAEREMQSAFGWWAVHRSKPQADRWYAGLAKAIAGLSENPERHAGREFRRDSVGPATIAKPAAAAYNRRRRNET